MKKVVNIVKDNFIIIMCIIIFILFCVFVSNNYMGEIKSLDSKIQFFFMSEMTTTENTYFMKNITLLGSAVCIITTFIICLFTFKDKIKKIILGVDLVFILVLSYALKEIFNRSRPAVMLIDKPLGNSFPSAHSYFASGFYFLLIYFLWQTRCSKFVKFLLTFIISMIVVFIGISRIYLQVHFFTDVISGFILGILTLVLFVNIYNQEVKK